MTCFFSVNFDPLTCDCPNPRREARFTTEVHFSRLPGAGSAAVLQAAGGGVSFEHVRYVQKNAFA